MATAQRLILASGSSGRRELLEKAGYRFEVMPSGVEEHLGEGVTDPRKYVAEFAWHKAAAVAEKCRANCSRTRQSSGEAPPNPKSGDFGYENVIILAADSTVWFQNKIIGKPADEAEARQILGSLSGTQHELWSGVC